MYAHTHTSNIHCMGDFNPLQICLYKYQIFIILEDFNSLKCKFAYVILISFNQKTQISNQMVLRDFYLPNGQKLSGPKISPGTLKV